MVEVFLIYVESIKSGNKGWVSQKTRKTDKGIKIEIISEIQPHNPEADISTVIAYYTRGAAENIKKLIIDEVELKYPGALINIDVQTRQINLKESQTVAQNTWVYK